MINKLDLAAFSFIAFKTVFPYIWAERYRSDGFSGENQITRIPFPGNHPFPEPFRLFQEEDSEYPSAGTLAILPSRYVVIVSSGFSTLSVPAQRFILLHESGHMFHKDQHRSTIVDLIIFVAARIFFPSHSFVAYGLIRLIAHTLLNNSCYAAADAAA